MCCCYCNNFIHISPPLTLLPALLLVSSFTILHTASRRLKKNIGDQYRSATVAGVTQSLPLPTANLLCFIPSWAFLTYVVLTLEVINLLLVSPSIYLNGLGTLETACTNWHWDKGGVLISSCYYDKHHDRKQLTIGMGLFQLTDYSSS